MSWEVMITICTYDLIKKKIYFHDFELLEFRTAGAFYALFDVIEYCIKPYKIVRIYDIAYSYLDAWYGGNLFSIISTITLK